MTETKFFGTYHYVSEEMKKIFGIKKQKYVDLYYNDIHALETAIKFEK
jgi:hypothetical protein